MARTTKGSGSAGRKGTTAKNIAKAAASVVVGAGVSTAGLDAVKRANSKSALEKNVKSMGRDAVLKNLSKTGSLASVAKARSTGSTAKTRTGSSTGNPKIYDTKAAVSARSNNATQRAVGKIANSTGMKHSSVLAAKSLGASGKTAAYKDKVNSLAEGDKKVAKRIETTLNARNKASKKK